MYSVSTSEKERSYIQNQLKGMYSENPFFEPVLSKRLYDIEYARKKSLRANAAQKEDNSIPMEFVKPPYQDQD